MINRAVKLNPKIGQPDIETPDTMLNAIKNFAPKVVEYSHSAGIESYRKKLSEYYKSYSIEVDYTEIMVTTGGSEALEIAVMACMNPDDELIIVGLSNKNGEAHEVSKLVLDEVLGRTN